MSEQQSHPAALVTPRFLDPLQALLIHRVRGSPRGAFLMPSQVGGRIEAVPALWSLPGQITIKKLVTNCYFLTPLL